MSKVLVTESSLSGIAAAIRAKNGEQTMYKPGQMAAAIANLPDAPTLISKTITQNGNYNPEDDNADGYSAVTVNVPNSYAAGDEGKVVSNGALVAQTARATNITANGTYDTTLNNSVTVNVGGSEPALPSDYQEVEYVICNGGQWINVTAPQLKNGTMFQYKAETTNTTAQTIIGNRSNASARWDAGWEDGAYYATNACYYIYKNVSSNLLTALLAIYGTTTEGFNYGSYQYSTKYPFYGNLYTLRVHRATIINDTFNLALLLKFIPCYRKSDNVIGFYEAVNGVFYTNAGSGQFGKGGDVT